MSSIQKLYCHILNKEVRIFNKTTILQDGNSDYDLTYNSGKRCLTAKEDFISCKKGNCELLGGKRNPFKKE